MKIFRTSILLLAASAFVFAACNKEKTPTDSIALNETSINFEVENAKRVSVEVTASGEWSAATEAKWVHVAPATGNGNTSVTIFADDNIADPGANNPERTAVITFTCGKATATLDIRQDGETIFFSVDGNAPVGYKGGTLVLKVKSNETYQVAVDADWVKYIATKAIREDALSFQIEENTSFDAREASITLTPASGDPIHQTVVQEGMPKEQERTFSFAEPLPYDDIDIIVNTAEGKVVVPVTGCKGKTSASAVVKVSDKYVIVAPSGAMDEEGNILVPQEQDGKAGVIYTALVADGATGINLTPVTAVVSASFTENQIARVVLEAQDTTVINGSLQFNFSDGTVTPIAPEAENGSLKKYQQITVNAGGDVAIAVLPGTYANGFVFEPYTADAVTTGAFIDGETVLAAGTVKAAAAVVKEYSFSAVAPLIDMYQQILLDDGTSKNRRANDLKAWRIFGTTLKLAAGTYDWPGATKAEFEGFPCPVKFAVEGAGASSTILNGGAFRAIFSANQTDLTIKELTFKSFAPSESNGGALSFYGNNTKGEVDDCIFVDNRCAAVNDKGELSSSGGSISFLKGSICQVNRCSFSSSDVTALLARNGGAFYTENGAEVTVKGCTFTNLSSFNTGGVSNNSGGIQRFEDCTVTGCTTQNGCGAAFHANAADAELHVKNCIFKACRPYTSQPYATVENKACGVISIQEALTDFDGCTFEDCEGSAAAIVNVQNYESFNKFSNCVFKGNRNASRGLVQLNGKSVTFLDNCVFYDNTTRTNAWGRIVHGGSPSIICMNNCTVANHHTLASGGNSVAVNNDGSILIANSSIVGDFAHSLVRNTNANSGANKVAVINTIAINQNASGKVFKTDHMRAAHTTDHVIFSASDDDVYTPAATDVANATVESVGLSFNSDSYCWIWNGAAMTSKAAASEVQTAVSAFNPTVSNKRVTLSAGATIGSLFYEWLTENGTNAKSYNGVSRGNAWWPGSYQN